MFLFVCESDLCLGLHGCNKIPKAAHHLKKGSFCLTVLESMCGQPHLAMVFHCVLKGQKVLHGMSICKGDQAQRMTSLQKFFPMKKPSPTTACTPICLHYTASISNIFSRVHMFRNREDRVGLLYSGRSPQAPSGLCEADMVYQNKLRLSHEISSRSSACSVCLGPLQAHVSQLQMQAKNIHPGASEDKVDAAQVQPSLALSKYQFPSFLQPQMWCQFKNLVSHIQENMRSRRSYNVRFQIDCILY